MLNINEDDLKAAIVAKASDEILRNDEDLSQIISREVKARIDKIFAERAQVQIEAAIASAIENSFDREYQRVTAWGEPQGPKTTIRAELLSTVSAYWSAQVDPRSGEPSTGYGDKITRAEWLMTQVCAEDFSTGLKNSVLSVTGALKDGLRVQLAAHMDKMLSDLFHIKSLQDQGKVEKPW